MAWNIGEELGIGRIDVGDVIKITGAVFLGKAALDAGAAKSETQNQTMKVITVAVIILITMYAIKRAS